MHTRMIATRHIIRLRSFFGSRDHSTVSGAAWRENRVDAIARPAYHPPARGSARRARELILRLGAAIYIQAFYPERLPMEPPDLAIIVTSYQMPWHVRRVLESIAAQRTTRRLEVVVSDDGSVDETPRVVADFASQAPFGVRFVTHPHTEFHAARCRNEGARNSSRAAPLVRRWRLPAAARSCRAAFARRSRAW